MRWLRATLLASFGVAITAPSAAQFVGRPDYGPSYASDPFLGSGRLPAPGIGRELNDIHGRIDRAREGGDLTRREARQFRREANQIGRLAGRYARNGLSSAEHHELQVRALALRGLVSRPTQATGRK